MELVLNNGFCNLSMDEMNLVNAGGWREFGYALGGSITTVAGVAGVIVSPGLGGKLTSGAAAVSGIATVVDGWTAK